MSINHYIKTKEQFYFEKLIKVVSKNAPAISFEQRGDQLYYFWQNNNAVRGADVSLENGLVELRNTIMSNETDYQITTFLAHQICENFDGETFAELDDDSDNERLHLVSVSQNFFNNEIIKEKQLSDIKIMRTIINQTGSYITLIGPKREVHFGTDFMTTYKDTTDEQLITIVHDLVKKVNYHLPDYEYGSIMQVGNEDDEDDEDKKNVKLLTNKVDCLINKYDYLLFQKSENQIIAITNDDLNSILPKDWTRVDEYTIVAPIISPAAFQQLIEQAEKINKFNEL